MRKFILGCLGVVTAVVAVQLTQVEVQAGLFDRLSACGPCDAACDAVCDPCDAACDTECNPCDMVCGKKRSGWFLGGHMEAGFYANEYGNKNLYGPGNTVLTGNRDLLQNVRNTGVQLNQGVIFGGKKADGRRGWDFGGRVDFMFGTDAYLVQSEGLEYGTGHGVYMSGQHADGRWGSGDYYSAMSQMYFEAERGKLNVKVGKFLTPMGHEGVYSTDRFFYSLSDAFAMLPVAQTGALFTYTVNCKLTAFGGWVQGDDQFFNTSHNNAFLGGVKYDFNKRLYTKYSVLLGRDTEQNNDRDYFVQSFIVGYKPGKRWDYTFEWTLRNENSDFGPATYYAGSYGINQELIYKINKKWAAGLRAEWSYAYNSYHVGNAIANSGTNKYAFTLGANWTPTSWLLVRPEIRYDKLDGDFTQYFAEKGGRTRDKQFSGGLSAVVKY